MLNINKIDITCNGHLHLYNSWACLCFFILYSKKKVVHQLLLLLCILNFQYLWNLEKWSDQPQIFRECLMYPLLLFLFRPLVLRNDNIFVTQKCKITIIMCSNNVFTIIVLYFIKNARKLLKLQLITSTSIYHNENWVFFLNATFQN